MTSSPQFPNANSERNTLRYQGQNYQFLPAYARNRDPTSNDLRDPKNQGYYSLPSIWVNTVTQVVWILVKRTSIQNGGATWVILDSSNGDIVQFTTDSGIVIPLNGNININGGYTTSNDVNGITVVSDPTLSPDMLVQITNRFQFSASFSDTNLHVLYTQNLNTVASGYLFKFDLIAFNRTSNLLSCYSITNPVRTTGSIAIGVQPPEVYQPEEGNMSGLSVVSGVNGPSNQFIITVQGYNTDNIAYNLTGTYMVRS